MADGTVLRGTALVTGATGGLGQAIARALAARVATLVLSGRRADALQPVADELRARTVIADLADAGDLDRLVAEAGEVDVLVNNAALPASGNVMEYDEDQLRRAVEVNLLAPMLLARRIAEPMVARGRGHIVFISSLSGKAASGAAAVYSATKFGIRGFALGLRQDLEPHGVGVSTVFPGFIRDAGMFAESGVKLPPGVGTRTPEDVGRAVVTAIERNRAEIDVAPAGLRVGAALAGLAPAASASMQRRLGGDKIALGLAEAQRAKR